MPHIVSALKQFSFIALAFGTSAAALAHILDTAGMEPVAQPEPTPRAVTSTERAYRLVCELLDGLTAQTMRLTSDLPSRCYRASRDLPMAEFREVLTALGEEPPEMHDNAAARHTLEQMLLSRVSARAAQVDAGRSATPLGSLDAVLLAVLRHGNAEPLGTPTKTAARLADSGLIETFALDGESRVRITLTGYAALVGSEAQVAS